MASRNWVRWADRVLAVSKRKKKWSPALSTRWEHPTDKWSGKQEGFIMFLASAFSFCP